MPSIYSSMAVAFFLAQQITQVAAHGAIISAVGDAGGEGRALAIDPSTPRDGTSRRPFQQDTTRFRDGPTGCGETLQSGTINIASAMSDLVQDMGGLPQVSAGGELTMTLHQVNADGAGPYTCMIDMSGTGASYTNIVVTQNVPGRRGRDRNGQETDFPLVAQLPANMQCTGTMGGMTGICMVRCQNPARAGPFGGCVPIQQVQDAPPAVAPVAAPVPVAAPAPVVAPVPVAAPAPVVAPVPVAAPAPVVAPAPVADTVPVLAPAPIAAPAPVVAPVAAPVEAPVAVPVEVPVASPDQVAQPIEVAQPVEAAQPEGASRSATNGGSRILRFNSRIARRVAASADDSDEECD